MGFDRTKKNLGIDAIRFTADAIHSMYENAQVVITFNEFNEFDYSGIDLQNHTLCSEADLLNKIEEVYNEWVASQYKRTRVGVASTGRGDWGYSSIGDQLDQLYHDVEAGKFGENAKTGAWFVGITSVKNAFPKP
tara:strand:+ start:1056 stop:1460 length:405 start_codon:yes stop_codon:yes gene_type:complete